MFDFFDNDSIHLILIKKTKFSMKGFVPIAEAIIEDRNIEESSVNIPNNGFIDCLPKDIVVEVPAIVDKNGYQRYCS